MLGIFHGSEVMASPDEEEHFHVEDDEEDDVGECGYDKEEISTLHIIEYTSELMIYWIWLIVCEKSSILHNDRVSKEILAENTKLGASIIFNRTKPQ